MGVSLCQLVTPKNKFCQALVCLSSDGHSKPCPNHDQRYLDSVHTIAEDGMLGDSSDSMPHEALGELKLETICQCDGVGNIKGFHSVIWTCFA